MKIAVCALGATLLLAGTAGCIVADPGYGGPPGPGGYQAPRAPGYPPPGPGPVPAPPAPRPAPPPGGVIIVP